MHKFMFGLFLFTCSIFSVQSLEARHVFKKYIQIREINFRDGHFRVKRAGKILRLKALRANNAGVYYIPRDVCKKRGLHRDHDNNKDSDIEAIKAIEAIEAIEAVKKPRRRNYVTPDRYRDGPCAPRGRDRNRDYAEGANGPGRPGGWKQKCHEPDEAGPSSSPEIDKEIMSHRFGTPGANGPGE